MLDTILSLIAPHYCYGCGLEGVALCGDCKKYIIDRQYYSCVVCDAKCPKSSLCSRHRLPYRQLYCASERKGAVRRLIDDYKFHRVQAADVVLAELLNEALPELSDTTIIVPIPTAAKNSRKRGYDHMWRIARRLGKLRGLPVRPLLRRRNNVTQHYAKTAAQRRKQAAEFFEVVGAVDPKATYLLIDDIFTTGATLTEAARALRKAGAKDIIVGVIARHSNDR